MEIQDKCKGFGKLKRKKYIEKIKFTLDYGIGSISNREVDDLHDVEEMLSAFYVKSEGNEVVADKKGGRRLKKLNTLPALVRKNKDFIVRDSKRKSFKE